MDRIYNNDGDDSDEPYSYNGSYSAWLRDIKVGMQKYLTDRYLAYCASFDVEFSVNPGKAVFPVYAKYRTGGSFGHEELFTIVDVFENHEQAQHLIDAINNDYSINTRGFGMTLVPKLNKEYYFGTWKGYFESLIEVAAVATMVQP